MSIPKVLTIIVFINFPSYVKPSLLTCWKVIVCLTCYIFNIFFLVCVWYLLGLHIHFLVFFPFMWLQGNHKKFCVWNLVWGWRKTIIHSLFWNVIRKNIDHGRKETCAAIAKETGQTIIHPFDDYRVMAGQATIALELLEEVSLWAHVHHYSKNV